MRLLRFFFGLTLLLTFSAASIGQQATIEGHVRTTDGEALSFVNLSLRGKPTGTSTGEDGFFSLRVPANDSIVLIISYIGYQTKSVPLLLSPDETRQLDIVLESLMTDLPDIEIIDRQILSGDITRLNPRLASILPGPGAGVESLIQTLPGVSTTTELSSQYSVRGGNYDENLVYVNGIEIYRPFLVRSGQHEGLSFLNPDLVSSIEFSAGGFNAEYGDKMASVLDITYQTPDEFGGSFSLSLLEGSLHLEGASGNQSFSYLLGVRYKSNQYLLGTLDAQGDYQPSFSDIQGLLRYRISDQWSLSLLGNYNNNRFRFEPEIRRTRFGTVSEVREFTVYFDGREVNLFNTTTGALSLEYTPRDNTEMQLITSVFQSDEHEHFDVMGQYWLHRVETDMGRDNFGQPVGDPLGVGTFLDHARNYLNAIVWTTEIKGRWNPEETDLRWGMSLRHEDIYDRLNEWSLVDSAGYSLPQHPPNEIWLQDTLNTQIHTRSNRLTAYLQNTVEILRPHGRFEWTAGVRTHYWDLNRQWVVSPRSTLLYKPARAPKWSFRGSAGYYHQPPFYRELRNMEGQLNEDIRAQESIHFVLGSTYHFTAWGRPFRYTTEAYYKLMNQLIPYEVDNVRIRYYADNSSRGYATGLDMHINGEFVPGIESWASMSLMQTREIIEGAYVTNEEGEKQPAGYLPRPTDQRFSFSLFFQDFLPRNPSYQVQLGFFYGTGLPFWAPQRDRQRNIGRMPSYQRVDIGFSKELIGTNTNRQSGPWGHLESVWLTAEVFNLLEINNTISYTWIRDVQNQQFAIPNYLTSRLINLKLIARF